AAADLAAANPEAVEALRQAEAARVAAEAAAKKAQAAVETVRAASKDLTRTPANDGGNAGGTRAIATAQNAQGVAEKYLGLRRGPPSPGIVATGPLYTSCGLVTRGRYVPGTDPYFNGACQYLLAPAALIGFALGPLLSTETEEITGPTAHHLSYQGYALDYTKESALTGAAARTEGFGLGYDITYSYDHPTLGLMAYGNFTWQQSELDANDFVYVTNYFVKTDAQVGLDLARLLATLTGSKYLAAQRMYGRIGPSLFHDWVRMGDHGSTGDIAYVDHLNEGVALVTGLGYEAAAEIDFRFPYDLGGLRFDFERGTYPSLNFPRATPQEAALIQLVRFDDLRAGSSYTWQRLKLELEIPAVFTRNGGVGIAGQIFKYENDRGTGVNNRGLSIAYNWRWK
ncbi:MAG: hypothetical protein FJ104_07125, partial [Deltaproteobacteria bacterium]|nr:hypothetical protein [Deltaproteobacteria bacterium]